jgi:hypothetical protein
MRWSFWIQLSLHAIDELLFGGRVIFSYSAGSPVGTRQSGAGAKGFARASRTASRLRIASPTPYGIGMTCFLGCAANHICYPHRTPIGVWRTGDQRGAKLGTCCRSVATRLRPSGPQTVLASGPNVPRKIVTDQPATTGKPKLKLPATGKRQARLRQRPMRTRSPRAQLSRSRTLLEILVLLRSNSAHLASRRHLLCVPRYANNSANGTSNGTLY